MLEKIYHISIHHEDDPSGDEEEIVAGVPYRWLFIAPILEAENFEYLRFKVHGSTVVEIKTGS
jgi:hypothetical protein